MAITYPRVGRVEVLRTVVLARLWDGVAINFRCDAPESLGNLRRLLHGGTCPDPAMDPSYKTRRPPGLAARPTALGIKHVAFLQTTHEDCLPLLRQFKRHTIWVSPFLSGRHARSVPTKMTEIVPQFL
jgi:hypothetical protein